MQDKLVCISENYQGLGDLGDPIIECRCTTVEALRSKSDPLADTVFHYLGQDGLNSLVEYAECSDGGAIYIHGNWTIEIGLCGNGGNCVGCPGHWYSTTGEIWENGVCWESIADAFTEMEAHLGRPVTKDERGWLIDTIHSCKRDSE